MKYTTAILHKSASCQRQVSMIKDIVFCRIESKTECLPMLRWQQWQQCKQQCEQHCHLSIRPVKRSTIYNSVYVFPTIFHVLRKDQNLAFSDDLQVDLEKWELALPGSVCPPFRKREEIVLNRSLLLVVAVSCIGKIWQKHLRSYTSMYDVVFGSLVLALLLAQQNSV